MILLQYMVPIGLFGYFLFRMRRSPIYACALPLLYCFSEAILLRQSSCVECPLRR